MNPILKAVGGELVKSVIGGATDLLFSSEARKKNAAHTSTKAGKKLAAVAGAHSAAIAVSDIPSIDGPESLIVNVGVWLIAVALYVKRANDDDV